MPNKPRKKCPAVRDQKPHASHTWTLDTISVPAEKAWCPGYEAAHVHIWDRDGQPIRHIINDGGILVGEGELWQGPLGCACGKSMWMVDGRPAPKERRVQDGADPMDRILILRERLNYNQGKLSEEDQDELNLIFKAVMEAWEPLVNAIQQLFESFATYLAGVDWKAIKEFVDAVAPEIVSDEDQTLAAEEASRQERATRNILNPLGDQNPYSGGLVPPSPYGRLVDPPYPLSGVIDPHLRSYDGNVRPA